MKRIITAIILASTVSAAMAAGEPMAFLKLGAGVRATALGGAYTSIPDDAAGAFYNPAGISSLKSLQFTAETYLMTFGRSVNYISACKAFNLGGHYYAAGLSWFNYSAGSDIEARSTNSPMPERQISDSSHLFMLTAATAISDRLFAGINAKLDLRVMDDVKATGFGFDAGILLKITEVFFAGVCASNLSSNTWWDNNNYNEPAPQSYSFGLSYRLASLFGLQGLNVLGSADCVLNTFGFMKLKGGLEATVNDFFSLRAGYNGAFSAGCGAVFKPSGIFSLKLDYALSADAILEGLLNHRVGLSMEFFIPEAAKGMEQEEQKKNGADDEEKPW